MRYPPTSTSSSAAGACGAALSVEVCPQAHRLSQSPQPTTSRKRAAWEKERAFRARCDVRARTVASTLIDVGGIVIAASPEKHIAGVRTVDRRVTHRAGLILGRLIVRGTGGPHDRKRMALQAQQVHLAHTEQAWIGGSMGHVARAAALCLNGNMLEHERSVFVSVALVAGRVAAR